MEGKGPIAITSKDQIGTGDALVYDKPQNKFTLIGNVALSQGENVTRGDQLTYDLSTGQAVVSSKGRVHTLIVPEDAKSGAAAGGGQSGQPSRQLPSRQLPSPHRQASPAQARACEGRALNRPAFQARTINTRPSSAKDGPVGEPMLNVHHLGKSYKARRVVEDVSLNVRRGEAVGLLGPNGAGKTTVFYMITGLIKPDKGMIELDGHDVTGLPMYRRARLGIGYLPQEASIFRGLSVEDNIRAVLEIVEPDRDRRAQQLDSLLEEFDIKRLRKTPSIALRAASGGAVEIARSLASNPSFMLLDEPFAGIDPIAVGDIQDLVRISRVAASACSSPITMCARRSA